MQIAMIGLGRMGANMVRRLTRAGHDCVVFDRAPEAVAALVAEGATGAASVEELVSLLRPPRAVWLMVPAALVDDAIAGLVPHLGRDDTVIDGGNSHYADDIRRAAALMDMGIHYVDVGTSGGVWGLERGYCQMIGGEPAAVARLQPIFAALAPPTESAPPTPGRTDAMTSAIAGASTGATTGATTAATTAASAGGSTAQHGYLHCGSAGAGHFVKMVHNGIEYGLMAAYAEGFNVLRHANIGATDAEHDAETTPLSEPELYRYDFDLPEIAELWRRGSVVASWLLDLTAEALHGDPDLSGFAGRVSDSGEGRWTLKAAIDEAVPTPVLSTALYQRFSSRGEADYADKLLSAMRAAFGGHREKP